jgi:hypothetical protein
MLARMSREGGGTHCWWNVNYCSHYGNSYGDSAKKNPKNRLRVWLKW